jgi:hypothetical protein
MQDAQPRHMPLSARNRPKTNQPQRDRTAQNGHTPRLSPSQFDLIVTFSSDAVARQALLSLREAGFGPDQAVLLTRGPLAQDELELAVEDLRTESWLAFGIVVATELAIGILLGGVIGWLIGLFHYAPQVGPVWQPILIFGCIGFLLGLVGSVLEWRRWRRVHLPTPGEAAIALRLRGPSAPRQLGLAQSVLERFGGQRETG